jgi:hypothetical protein
MSVIASQLRATPGGARAQRSFVAAQDQGLHRMSVGRRTTKTNEGHERVALPQPLDRGIGCCESCAVFGAGRKWRYRLVRVWDSDKPRLAWVILNGSDADEHRTDATVRRCIGFARAWGYGGVDIANVYGLVSKNRRAESWKTAHLLVSQKVCSPTNARYRRIVAIHCGGGGRRTAVRLCGGAGEVLRSMWSRPYFGAAAPAAVCIHRRRSPRARSVRQALALRCSPPRRESCRWSAATTTADTARGAPRR